MSDVELRGHFRMLSMKIDETKEGAAVRDIFLIITLLICIAIAIQAC